MAILERIKISPMQYDRDKNDWVMVDGKTYEKVPHIFFSDGQPWNEVNAYSIAKIKDHDADTKTVASIMSHLKAYADWLEENKIDWRYFPKPKKERCLFRYRGYLISKRNDGDIAPSTASVRMGAVVRFYRWAMSYNLIERIELWLDQRKNIYFLTNIGFKRSVTVLTSELSIPNRARHGLMLEGGLLPISVESRDILLNWLNKYYSQEIYLMVKIGFLTGARSETIRTLRLSTIENSIVDGATGNFHRISVGPGTGVKTKNGVYGYILFPSNLIRELQNYASSIDRLVRQSKASKDNRTLLFLTVRGNAYLENSFTKIISNMREKLIEAGLGEFQHFKFHQTRSTYGTEVMKVALQQLESVSDAIVFVRDALLHKHESTTWRYVKFVQQEPLKMKLANEFFDLFKGNY